VGRRQFDSLIGQWDNQQIKGAKEKSRPRWVVKCGKNASKGIKPAELISG